MLMLRENFDRGIDGLDNPVLYTTCSVGTKHLIENYVSEIVRQLHELRDANEVAPEDKERFFADSRQALGTRWRYPYPQRQFVDPADPDGVRSRVHLC